MKNNKVQMKNYLHNYGVAENARPEIAGQENNGPNRKA